MDGRNESKKEMETVVIVLLCKYAKWFLNLGFELNLRSPHSDNAFIDWGFTLIPVSSIQLMDSLKDEDRNFCGKR